MINLPAMFIAGLVTMLLVIGTRELATVNAFLVVIKVAALTLFVVLALPVMNMENFEPFAPLSFGGIGAAAARSEEHTSELQSLMRISYAVFCLKKKNTT